MKDYQICIDGKRAKGVNPRNELHQRLHILSAWVSDFNICIGQQSTDQKSNEITALPLLIEQLETSNATVSIDAMGCQSDIADQIAKKEGRYLLSFKMNQPNTYDLVDKMFKIKQVHSESDTENMHGKRYEFRECSVINLTV